MQAQPHILRKLFKYVAKQTCALNGAKGLVWFDTQMTTAILHYQKL